MKVNVIEATIINGKPAFVGETKEVSAATGNALILAGKAKPAKGNDIETAAVEPGEKAVLPEGKKHKK